MYTKQSLPSVQSRIRLLTITTVTNYLTVSKLSLPVYVSSDFQFSTTL